MNVSEHNLNRISTLAAWKELRMEEGKVVWPKIGKFLSEAEIVTVLFERMKDAEGVQDFIKEGPGMYHHTLGTAVRNEFWLWHPDNPHAMKDYAPQLVRGVDYNPRHADNMSGRILKALHAKIKAYHSSKAHTPPKASILF